MREGLLCCQSAWKKAKCSRADGIECVKHATSGTCTSCANAIEPASGQNRVLHTLHGNNKLIKHKLFEKNVAFFLRKDAMNRKGPYKITCAMLNQIMRVTAHMSRTKTLST